MLAVAARALRLATTNHGKLREFRQILEPLGFCVRDLAELGPLDIVEDGATFAANALKKARVVMELTGEPTIGDDSGLEVDALAGAPGVHSARYAGFAGPEQDARNRAKLLQALAAVAPEKRTARFVCVLAYCAPQTPAQLFRGVFEGRIATAERGQHGFGYDALFEVPHLGRTAAELAPQEKNALSHRGQAVQALAAFLRDAAGRGDAP